MYGIRRTTRNERNRCVPSLGLIPLMNVREEESRRGGLVVAQLGNIVNKEKAPISVNHQSAMTIRQLVSSLALCMPYLGLET